MKSPPFPLKSRSLERYVTKELVNQTPLPAEEEYKLAKRIKKGDEKARNELVSANLRFVVTVAKEYQNQGLPLNDLIAEGNFGLVAAAERFDETKGFKFISYAVWWIRQSILKATQEQTRTIRIPSNRGTVLKNIRKAVNNYTQTHQRDFNFNSLSDLEYLASELDLSVDYLRNTLTNTQHISSLDYFLDSNDKEINDQYAVVEDTSQTRQDEDFERKDLKSGINHALEKLSPREAEIIERHFGLNGYETHTLEEIGKNLTKPLTRERIRQIRDIALKKLKHPGKGSRKLRTYL